MNFGRKFWAGLLGVMILMFIFVFTARVVPAAITSTVLIVYGSLIVTIIFMYIGGNVWSSWIKSKYFHPELSAGGVM
jgi:hypothetical protein